VSYATLIEGANPTWLTFSFPDGRSQTFSLNEIIKVEHKFILRVAWVTLGGLFLGFGLALMLIISFSD